MAHELVLGVVLVRVVQELDGPRARPSGQEELWMMGDDVGQVWRDIDGDIHLAVLERCHANGARIRSCHGSTTTIEPSCACSVRLAI
jgi:hypothetical protein